MKPSGVGAVAAATLGTLAVALLGRRGTALAILLNMYAPERKPLGEVVLRSYKEYRGNAILWSGVYFTCLFGSAFLSAFAGIVLKLDFLVAHPNARNDLSASSAMAAALLITLTTVGEFQRKWQSNRIAASAMENLAFDLLKTDSDPDAVVDNIKAINEARNRGIVGEQLDGSRPGKSGSGKSPGVP